MDKQRMLERQAIRRIIPFVVFLISAAFLWWVIGSHFMIIPDEGIYLDGALRMLRGETPYRDFFALTGPGTYWIQFWSLSVFGTHLWSTRIPVILDLALITALVFWLTDRLSGRAAALVAVTSYFVLQTNYFTALQASHRWDSSALALASVALAFWSVDVLSLPGAFFAGLVVAAATWVTPSMAILLAAMILCLALRPQWRRLVPAFGAGLFACFVAGTVFLARQGALIPMIDHLFWSASNYSGANRTPYGWVLGGYANLLRAPTISQAIPRWIVVALITLPVTLPFFCLIGWPVRLWRDRTARDAQRLKIPFLLICSVALLASTFPRPDLMHLMYVAPLFYVLGASLLTLLLTRKSKLVAIGLIAAISGALLTATIQRRLGEQTLDTRQGRIRGPKSDIEIAAMVTSRVLPGDSLFVFPYCPVFYFLTDTRNPTRYSFLQPGMFTADDEKAAHAALTANPPRWVLYFNVTPEMYLGTWPSSDPARLRMPSIERVCKKAVSHGGNCRPV